MHLELDNKVYSTTPEQDEELWDKLVALVPTAMEKLPESAQLGLKPIFRGILFALELKIPELKDEIRPPKGADPMMHIFTLGKRFALPQVANATISITSNKKSGAIGSISFLFPSTSQSG